MQKLIITILFTFLFAAAVNAQTVEVPQELLDRANQAFKEVSALRELVSVQKEALQAKEKVISSQDAAINAKDALIKIKDEQIEKLIAIKCTKSSFLLFVYKSKKCY